MNELIELLNARAPDILRTLGLMELQIALLALLVLAIERLLRQPLPKIRYALWLVVLAKCLLPPFLPIPASVQLPMAQLALPTIFAVVTDNAVAPLSMPTLSFTTIILIFYFIASFTFAIIALHRYRLLRNQLRDSQSLALPNALQTANHFGWPPILITKNLPTPVAVGFFRPRIYLTEVATKFDHAVLQAVLYHELAHVLRRDGWVVLLQTIAQIFHPFNPMVWLMNLRLSRYREEICDDFALQQTAVLPRQYGEMLLRFLETSATSPLAIQAGTCFFETANGFKQRLKYLLTPKEVTMNRFTWKHKILLAGMLAALLAASWQCNHKLDSPLAPPEEKGVAATLQPQFDKGPSITHRASPKYPENAKAANLEGLVWAKIWIGEDGKVQNVAAEKCSVWVCPNLGAVKAPALKIESVSNQEFVDAVVAAANQFEFEPALLKGQPVPTSVMVPFHFRLDDHRSSNSALPIQPPAPGVASDMLSFDQALQLVKPVAAAYPQLAKLAGIEGTVWVKVRIDENGKVVDAQVQKSSRPDVGFEEAAVAAAKAFEFAPAQLNHQPIAVWLSLPFHFRLSPAEQKSQNQ